MSAEPAPHAHTIACCRRRSCSAHSILPVVNDVCGTPSRLPVTGVRAGASLAGNDSSEAASSGSGTIGPSRADAVKARSVSPAGMRSGRSQTLDPLRCCSRFIVPGSNSISTDGGNRRAAVDWHESQSDPLNEVTKIHRSWGMFRAPSESQLRQRRSFHRGCERALCSAHGFVGSPHL